MPVRPAVGGRLGSPGSAPEDAVHMAAIEVIT